MGAFEFDSFTLPEAFRALRVSAGLAAAASEGIGRLDVVDTEYSTRRIDTLNGVRIVRKVCGLESNP